MSPRAGFAAESFRNPSRSPGSLLTGVRPRSQPEDRRDPSSTSCVPGLSLFLAEQFSAAEWTARVHPLTHGRVMGVLLIWAATNSRTHLSWGNASGATCGVSELRVPTATTNASARAPAPSSASRIKASAGLAVCCRTLVIQGLCSACLCVSVSSVPFYQDTISASPICNEPISKLVHALRSWELGLYGVNLWGQGHS